MTIRPRRHFGWLLDWLRRFTPRSRYRVVSAMRERSPRMRIMR